MLLPRLDTIIWSFFEEEEARSFLAFIEERGYPAQLVDLDDPRFSPEPGFMTKTGVLVDGRDQHLIKRHLLTWLAIHVKTVNVRDFPKLPKFESVQEYQKQLEPVHRSPTTSVVDKKAVKLEEFQRLQTTSPLPEANWPALTKKYRRSIRLAFGLGAGIAGFWLPGAWVLPLFLIGEYAYGSFRNNRK